MKVPTNRAKFMDELRANLEDVIPADYCRSYLIKKYIGEFAGHEYYIDFTEDEAPQHLEIKSYIRDGAKVCIEFCKDEDRLVIYVDGKYKTSYEFELYKNKTAYTAAIAIYVARIVR